MDLEIYVDGRPLSTIAPWGDPVIEHRWPYGMWEIRWSQPLKPWQRPQQFKLKKSDGAPTLVRAKVGPHTLGWGQLADLDWDEGTFAAVGLARQGEETLCLDPTGKTTSTLDTAINYAVTRAAVNWWLPVSISAVPFGGGLDETRTPNYLSALLDVYTSELVGYRWYVDATAGVRVAPDPVSPSVLILPDRGVMGTSDAALVGTVICRYLSSSTGLIQTASYGSGRPELGVSFVDQAPMSGATATTKCQAIWTDLQGKTGWVNGITVQTGDLRNMGGVQTALWMLQAGPQGMVRMAGVRDERSLLMNTDFVAGRTVWKQDDDSLLIEPVGKAARSETDVIETYGGVLLS